MDSQLRCNGFAMSGKGASMTLSAAYDAAHYTVWKNSPGTVVSVSPANGNMVVQLTRCNVKLPTVTLPAHKSSRRSSRACWARGARGRMRSIGGVLRGGMTFTK